MHNQIVRPGGRCAGIEPEACLKKIKQSRTRTWTVIGTLPGLYRLTTAYLSSNIPNPPENLTWGWEALTEWRRCFQIAGMSSRNWAVLVERPRKQLRSILCFGKGSGVPRVVRLSLKISNRCYFFYMPNKCPMLQFLGTFRVNLRNVQGFAWLRSMSTKLWIIGLQCEVPEAILEEMPYGVCGLSPGRRVLRVGVSR